MNIIACSYTNLGPFANKTVSLVIHPGAAMIIAPVGTGKSMLFFDGPVYGLYKYGTRDVLNNMCDTGAISILIEIDGEYRLIRRQLKATKARSISTVSSLARYHSDVSQIYIQFPEIIYADCDIISELDMAVSETLVFKNETDLQKNLEVFLPPRDVFMNRDMMMQESANIFDLTQTERISVFKHLFGLLDIDVAKEKLSDEKTKLKYLLQARKDTSTLTTKFSQTIGLLQQSWSRLADYSLINLSDYDGQLVDQWLDNSSILGTTIAIEQVPLIERNQSSAIRHVLEGYKQQYHHIHAQVTQYSDQQKQFAQQLSDCEKNYIRLNEQLRQYDLTLSTYNAEQLQKYKTEKLTLIQESNNLEFALNYDVFDGQVEDLQQAYEYVTKLTQQGKELGLKLNHIATQITGIKDKQQLEIAHRTSQIEMLDKQLSQLHQQLALKEEKLTIVSRFYCSKIEADCPFVGQLSDGVITAHERELEQIKAQYLEISQRKSHIETQTSITDYSAHIVRLTQEQITIESQVQQLRSHLVQVGYKQIMDSYPQYQQIQIKLKTVDQQIAIYESKLQELEQILHAKSQTEAQVQQIQAEILKIKTEKAIIDEKQQGLQQQSDKRSVTYQQITTYEGQLQTIVDHIGRINDIITDYKIHQQEIIVLEARAKHVDELYLIVSKELTVLVLQEYLPILSDMINNQLAKVVDYRLDFTVNKAGDKLEIMIIDQYGSREVKSLSGGQRAVLRLCWILAIALWSGNKFLFLDETINHLDKEMVSKAAELIEEFVQGNKVTLYAITHSDQIQELDIWDYVVRVREVVG